MLTKEQANKIIVTEDTQVGDGISADRLANWAYRRLETWPELVEACKNSPAPNFFADFANFADDCSQNPNMTVYKPKFIALAVFLRSCTDRAEQILVALAKAGAK